MPALHRGVLTDTQRAIVPLIEVFASDFGLVGGTAIALQLGHRQSIDFDLCTNKYLDADHIRNAVAKRHKIQKVIRKSSEEYTIIVKDVKCTFFYYPFPVRFTRTFGSVKMPALLTLAAMKAYALGRRTKWKDYVDLYCTIQSGYALSRIIKTAKRIFGSEFNEKMFRVQLAYFDDVDYTEKVIYCPGHEVNDETIKKELTRMSLSV